MSGKVKLEIKEETAVWLRHVLSEINFQVNEAAMRQTLANLDEIKSQLPQEK